jgi:hypothetical protein
LPGFAFVAVPAAAQSQMLCSFDKYGRAYNCTTVLSQQCGSCCNTCGNRGLFTSTWVHRQAPCGYHNPCQQVVQPQHVEQDDEPYIRRAY